MYVEAISSRRKRIFYGGSDELHEDIIINMAAT